MGTACIFCGRILCGLALQGYSAIRPTKGEENKDFSKSNNPTLTAGNNYNLDRASSKKHRHPAYTGVSRDIPGFGKFIT